MSSIAYFWNNCPQWLFQWFICGAFYIIICVWSFIEYIRITVKLTKLKRKSKQSQSLNNNNHHLAMDITSNIADNFDQSYNFNFSFNNNNNKKTRNDSNDSNGINDKNNLNIHIAKTTTKTKTFIRNNNKRKLRIFGSRASQKIFLIITFFQALFRSIEFILIGFIKKDKCSMSVIDSISGSDLVTIWYTYCEILGALLFPQAFSCLAYQLAKIYYRFNYESISIISVKRNVYRFLYALISVNIICFFGTLGLLFWDQFGTNNNSMLQTYITMLYGIMCIILAICYARFAFPIFKIYRKIHGVTNHKQIKNEIIGDNIKKTEQSLENNPHIKSPQVSEDHLTFNNNLLSKHDLIFDDIKQENLCSEGSLLYSDYDIYTIKEYKERSCNLCCCCYKLKKNGNNTSIKPRTFTEHSRNANKVKMSTDVQYAKFITSMKRTWITALYCGIAFCVRAIILMFPTITNWYEHIAYVHAIYFILLEILPIFAMLYIYGNATKSMTF